MTSKAPLKVAAVVSSIALVGGYIWFASGQAAVADESRQSVRVAKTKNAPAPSAVTQSAKASSAQQTAAPEAKPRRTIMSGSKSLSSKVKSDSPSK